MRDYPADHFFAFSLSSETPCHKKHIKRHLRFLTKLTFLLKLLQLVHKST